jgi:hypothetical protein
VSSAYYFSFTFRGDTHDMKDRIVESFWRFGCPVYDPQCDELQPLDEPWGFPPGKSNILGSKFVDDISQELAKLRAQATAQGPKAREALERELAKAEEQAAAFERQQEESYEKAAAARQKEEQRREEEERKKDPQKYEFIAQIARECAGGRWERLGVTAKECGELIIFTESFWEDPQAVFAKGGRCITRLLRLTPPPRLQMFPYSSLPIHFLLRVVALKFYEAIPTSHPFYDSLGVAQLGIAGALEYFFGDWREGFVLEGKSLTRAETRQKRPWFEPYRQGLLLAFFADDDESIEKLLEWPDTDLPVDTFESGMTAADNQGHIALATVLRGDTHSKTEQILTRVLGSGRKRAIAFASAVRALSEEDAAAFGKHLKDLSNLYLKKLPRQWGVEIHVDGSILWQTARRRKLALPELRERNLDLILRR